MFKDTTLLATHTGGNKNAQRKHSKFANDKPQRRKPLAHAHAHTIHRTYTHTHTHTHAHAHAHTHTHTHEHTHNTTQNNKHPTRKTPTTGPNKINKHRARFGGKLVLDNVLPDVFKPQLSVADTSCHWHFAAPAVWGLLQFCLGLCLHPCLRLLLLHHFVH